MATRPQNIGIKAQEIYIPTRYVDQSELEKHYGVPAGKYTIGLGQTRMAFVNDREDIYSIALTALSRLLKKNNIEPNQIGHLEVGTETLLDKAKSVKTVLMQLLGDNHDVEGVDTYNACYGGTNALFSAVNWVESSSWDGRYAVVLAGDIAIYAEGAARPTGGAGITAMLIGPDAPIVIESTHGSYMEHAYDFYKPDFTSEYPVVDGHFSLTCYTRALDHAYANYLRKAGKEAESEGVDYFAAAAFHVPTCKLVTKSFARLLYDDYRRNPARFEGADIPSEVKATDYEASLTDRTVEKTFLALAKERSKTELSPGLYASTNTGNIYSGSLYLSLASVLAFTPTAQLSEGKRISMFSYGSGLAASFYAVRIAGDYSGVVAKTDLKGILERREAISPVDYEKDLELREKAHLKKDFKPSGSIDHLEPGTYYLVSIDDKFRREYAIKK